MYTCSYTRSSIHTYTLLHTHIYTYTPPLSIFLFSNIFNQAVLEINPNHPIIQRLDVMYTAGDESPEAKELVELVFSTSALAAGYVLDNAAEYSQMVTNLMTRLVSK